MNIKKAIIWVNNLRIFESKIQICWTKWLAKKYGFCTVIIHKWLNNLIKQACKRYYI